LCDNNERPVSRFDAAGGRRIIMEFAPWHWIVVGVVVVLLFGGRKLPELGKGLGEGWKGFKDGLKGMNDEPNASTKPGETAHIVTPKPDETPKV
jgi:sec-independent protein translocase protein TatA